MRTRPRYLLIGGSATFIAAMLLTNYHFAGVSLGLISGALWQSAFWSAHRDNGTIWD